MPSCILFVTPCPSRFSLGAELQGHRSLGSRPTKWMLFVGHGTWGSLSGPMLRLSSNRRQPISQQGDGLRAPGSTTGSVMRSRYLRRPAFPFHTQSPNRRHHLPWASVLPFVNFNKKGTPRPSIQHQIEAFGDWTKFDTCSSRRLTRSGSIPPTRCLYPGTSTPSLPLLPATNPSYPIF